MIIEHKILIAIFFIQPILENQKYLILKFEQDFNFRNNVWCVKHMDFNLL